MFSVALVGFSYIHSLIHSPFENNHSPIGSVDDFFSANVVYSPFHIKVMQKSTVLLHLQLQIDEFNHFIVIDHFKECDSQRYFNEHSDKTTKEQREAVQFYYNELIHLIESCKHFGNLHEWTPVLEQADLIIGKYAQSIIVMSRIKWIWTLVLHEQIESCRSHVAQINYLRIFSGSFVLGLVISILCIIIKQKSAKKLKELQNYRIIE